MKTLEIYKTRKDELVEKTIELMPTSLSGYGANRAFFFKVDEKTGELTVNYFYYAGQQSLSDNCFYTIKDHMDFDVCGFSEQIEDAIEQHILNLETFEN